MDTATTEIYTYGHTLSLHDARPISSEAWLRRAAIQRPALRACQAAYPHPGCRAGDRKWNVGPDRRMSAGPTACWRAIRPITDPGSPKYPTKKIGRAHV